MSGLKRTFGVLADIKLARERKVAARAKSKRAQMRPVAVRASQPNKVASHKRGAVDELRSIEQRVFEINRELSRLENAPHIHRPLPPGRAHTLLSSEGDTTACPTCNEEKRLRAEANNLGKPYREAQAEVVKSAMASHAGLAKARASKTTKISMDAYEKALNKQPRSQKQMADILAQVLNNTITQPTLRKFQRDNGLKSISRPSKKKSAAKKRSR